jgi:hypothetical protein
VNPIDRLFCWLARFVHGGYQLIRWWLKAEAA